MLNRDDAAPRTWGGRLVGRARLLGWAVALCTAVLWSGTAHAGELSVTYEDGVDADGNPSRVAVLHPVVYFMNPDVTREEMSAYCPIFKEVSRLLFDATEGRMRLGKVILTTSESLKTRADIRVTHAGKTSSTRAVAQRDAWDKAGQHVLIVQEVHVCDGKVDGRADPNDPNAPTGGIFAKCRGTETNGAFGILHELGHYLFDLGDEYAASFDVYCPYFRPADCKVCDPEEARALREKLKEMNDFGLLGYCAHGSRTLDEQGLPTVTPVDPATNEPAQTHMACIMDGGTAQRNYRREFCNDALSDNAHLHEAVWRIQFGCHRATIYNTQHGRHNKSCWEEMAESRFVKTHFLDAGFPFGIGMRRPKSEPAPVTVDGDCDVGGASQRKALQLPGASTSLYVPNETRIVIAPPAFALVVDTSGSMGDDLDPDGDSTLSKMAAAKIGARNAVDIMLDGEALGMVDMNEHPNGEPDPLGMDDVSVAHLAAARDAVADLEPAAKTALGDALDRAKAMLEARTDEETSGKFVILISDGRSTVGKDPLSALAEIKGETRISIYTIAVGPEADRQLLARIADQTGGQMFIVDRAAKLVPLIPRVFDIARGEVESFDQSLDVQPSASTGEGADPVTVTVGAFDETATFLIGFEQNWDFSLELEDPSKNRYTIELEGGQPVVVLIDPDGGRSKPPASDVKYVANSSQIFFRVNAPGAGDWTIGARNNNKVVKQEVSILVSHARGRVSADAYVAGGANVVYPAPIRVEVPVVADGPVLGADVRANVSSPGSAPDETILLYDDGLVEHGDRYAGDGVYSALYANYESAGSGKADGTYKFTVTVENKDGVLLPGEGVSMGMPIPQDSVPPFKVVSEAFANVVGTPRTVTSGSVIVSTANSGRVRSVLPADLNTDTVLQFALEARDEYVLLEKLTIRADTDDPADQIDYVALYRDEDGNGEVDNPFRPLATGRFVAAAVGDADYELTFESQQGDFLDLLAADESQGYVIAVGRPQPKSGAIAPVLPGLSGSGAPVVPVWLLVATSLLVFVLLVPASRGHRGAQRVAVAATVTALFLCVGAVGCGGGGGGDPPPMDPTTPTGPNPPDFTGRPTPIAPVAASLILKASDVSGTGLTTSGEDIPFRAGSSGQITSTISIDGA